MATLERFQHVFPNGLTLLAERMPTLKSAAFTLMVPAGAAYDPPNGLGTATVLSEWMMRGAGTRDSRALVEDLDNLGVSHRVSAQTVHLSIAAATLGRNLPAGLSILADVLLDPHLPDDQFEPVRSLAIQSLRSLEDDPGSKALVELRMRHFPAPWGRHALGTLNGIESLEPESVRQFHECAVRPNGAILAAAGEIDWDGLRDQVEALFGRWHPRPDPPLVAGPRGPSRDHVFKETQQVQIGLALPLVPVTHPEAYHARAATAILGGYSSARLFTEVREKRGLCYSVSAAYESLKHQAAMLCHAGTSTDRSQQTLDVMLAEVERLKRKGVLPEELETLRAGLKSSWIMQQESSLSRSSQLATDWYYLGRVRSLDEIARELDALTPASVSDFCAQLDLDPITILTLGPSALRVPESCLTRSEPHS